MTASPRDPALAAGQRFLAALHAEMVAFAKPAMALDDLFVFAECRIRDAGFENLDFLGNVGHSMAARREDRVFIERGSRKALGEVGLFTFEPHVRQVGGRWGFKHENIYSARADGTIEAL